MQSEVRENICRSRCLSPVDRPWLLRWDLKGGPTSLTYDTDRKLLNKVLANKQKY